MTNVTPEEDPMGVAQTLGLPVAEPSCTCVGQHDGSCALTPKATVFVLIIEHRHGQNMSVHKTREGAEENLDAYVQDYWDELSDHDQPDSQAERIELYFQDHPDDETYTLEEVEVLD